METRAGIAGGPRPEAALEGNGLVRREHAARPFDQPASDASTRPVQTLARVEWEHIQRVLTDCAGNISQAARLLGLHRRSLQRKLSKKAPR